MAGADVEVGGVGVGAEGEGFGVAFDGDFEEFLLGEDAALLEVLVGFLAAEFDGGEGEEGGCLFEDVGELLFEVLDPVDQS